MGCHAEFLTSMRKEASGQLTRSIRSLPEPNRSCQFDVGEAHRLGRARPGCWPWTIEGQGKILRNALKPRLGETSHELAIRVRSPWVTSDRPARSPRNVQSRSTNQSTELISSRY